MSSGPDINRKSFGLIAQLGERSVRIREVEGSSPFGSMRTANPNLYPAEYRFGFVISRRWRQTRRAGRGVCADRKMEVQNEQISGDLSWRRLSLR